MAGPLMQSVPFFQSQQQQPTTGNPYSVDQATLARKQRMADMLLQQSMEPMQVDQRGPASWTQTLGKLLAGYGSMKANEGIAEDQAKLARQFQEGQSAATQQFSGLMQQGKYQDAANFALTSQFPVLHKLGEDALKQLSAQREAYGKVGERMALPQAAQIAQTGSLPSQVDPKQEIKYVNDLPVATPTEYAGPQTPSPQRIGPGFEQRTIDINGARVPVQINPLTGKQEGAGSGQMINVDTGNKAGDVVAAEDSKAISANAQKMNAEMPNQINTLNRIESMVKQGSLTGPGQDFRKNALQIARMLGLTPEQANQVVASTEARDASIGGLVRNIIHSFGSGSSASETDREYSKQLAGGGTTSPEGAMQIIQAAKADLMNSALTHNYQAQKFASGVLNRPDLGQYWQVNINKMPTSAIDADMYNFNPDSGLFEYKQDFKGYNLKGRGGLLGGSGLSLPKPEDSNTPSTSTPTRSRADILKQYGVE